MLAFGLVPNAVAICIYGRILINFSKISFFLARKSLCGTVYMILYNFKVFLNVPTPGLEPGTFAL